MNFSPLFLNLFENFLFWNLVKLWVWPKKIIFGWLSYVQGFIWLLYLFQKGSQSQVINFNDENLPWDYFEISKSKNGNLKQINSLHYWFWKRKPSSKLQFSFLNQLMYRLIIRIASLISLQLDTNKLIILLILKKRKLSSGHQFYDKNLPWDYFKIL